MNVRSAAFFMLPSAVGMVVPLATLPIITRWLTPVDYGIFALAQVATAVFAGLASWELRLAVERNFFKYEGDRRQLARLLYSSLAIVVVGTVVCGAVLYAVAGPLSRLLYGTGEWRGIIVAASVAGSLNVVVTVPHIYLRNSGRARSFAGFQVVGMLLESGLAVVLVAVFELGVWGLALAPVIGRLAMGVILWSRLAFELRPAISRPIVMELLRMGWPLLPRTWVSTLDGGIDRVLIGWLSSLGQAGLFSMANRLGGAAFAVTTGVEQVFVPRMFRLLFESEGRRQQAAVAVGRYLSPYFFACIAVSVGIILFAEELLYVLVTPAFYDVRHLAAVLGAYYGQMFFGKIVGVQLMYRELTWYVTPLTILRLVVHGGLSLVLITQYGALGACFALVLGGMVVDGVAVVIGHRVCPIRYEGRVVVPGLLLLYGATAWVLVSPMLDFGYPARLAGKALLVVGLLMLGSRWLPAVYGWVATTVMGAQPAARGVGSST